MSRRLPGACHCTFSNLPAYGFGGFIKSRNRRIELKIKIAFFPLIVALCFGFTFSGCGSKGIPVEVIDSGA